MQFQDEVVGGVTLIRPAIQSANFLTGAAGWQIASDGTAEFSDLTIRSSDGSGNTVTVANGTIVIRNAANAVVVEIDSTGYRLYNAAGDIVAEIKLDAPVGGFYTRNFLSPQNIYAFLSGGQLTSGPVNNSLAAIHGYLQYIMDPGGGIYTVQTLSTGLQDLLLDDEARVQLVSQRGQRSKVWVDGGSSAVRCDLYVTGSARNDEDVITKGVIQGRGITAFGAIIANSAAASAETVYLTKAGVVFADQRAYRISIKGFVSSTVANDRVQMRVRKTNLAGTTYLNGGGGGFPLPGNELLNYSAILRNTTGGPLTQTLVATFQRVAGTGNLSVGANATDPAYLHVEDIGAAADFVNAAPIS